MVLIAALIGAASAAAWKAARTTTGHEWYAVGMLVLAETLIDAGMPPHRPKDVRHPDGRVETVTLGTIANHRPLIALRKHILDDLLNAALLGSGIGAGIVVAALVALHYAGRRLKRGRRLRGGELVSTRQLRRALRLLVLPAEIARLDSLAGYLKFPGAWPVARIKLRYAKRPKVAERFVPKAEGEAGAGEAEPPGEAGREATRPGSKAAKGKPGGTKDVIGPAPDAEAAVDLWEPDPTAMDWAERDLDAWAMSRADEGWPEEIVPLPAATYAGRENAEAFRPSLRGKHSAEGNGGDAGVDEATVRETARAPTGSEAEPDSIGGYSRTAANRLDARDGSAPGDGKPASGLIRI